MKIIKISFIIYFQMIENCSEDIEDSLDSFIADSRKNDEKYPLKPK